jgi:geranylgeranyl diphosphate synthase type I
VHFEELGRYLPAIERELSGAYARARRSEPTFAPWTARLEEFTLRGGKRFRALLVLAGYALAAHRDPRPALPAAAALEHFQSWMLIHDDIIDHAETRRGGPAVHRALATELSSASSATDAERYGLGAGITLGDLEEPYTVAALLSVRAPPARRLSALAEYVRMTRDTAYGQLLDIRSSFRSVGEVSEEDVLTVHRLKTAVYTVAAPLRIGAILGGAGPGLLRDLEAIGLDQGMAFQLRDDVLGAGFDAGASGKSANDVAEGKRTLLIVHAWRSCDAAGRATIGTALGKPGLAPAELEKVQALLRSSGSLAYSEGKIEWLARRAERRIARSRALRAGDRELLREIGDRLVHRAA